MSNPATWLPLPLVGRDQELLALRRGLDAAAAGTCTLHVIAGGYGVGKTRLVQALVDESASRGYASAIGVAYQNDVNVPYAAFADALTPLMRGLDPGTLSVLARGTEAELSQVIPAIGGERGERRRATDDAGDLTTRVRWHFAQFLTRLTARRPLLLAIDNVQWADPSSVSLLQFVVKHAPEARLMVVMAYNQMEADAASPFRAMARSLPGRGATQLTLTPLTERDVRDMLTRAFRVSSADVRDFAALLHARTLGNPFFIQEILKTLVDRGSLRFVDERWVGWNLEDFELPDTVREVVLARVQQLTATARHVADVAAVFGVRVRHELLESVSGLSPAQFVDAVEALRDRHVIAEIEEDVEIHYDFTHPLLQRILYEEVGAARRRELHARIAEVIERRAGADADRHATQLAHHFVRSGTSLAPKSFRYLVLAGRDALVKHADREAARYLQHALDIIDRGATVEGGSEALTAVLEDLARVRQRLTEYDASRVLWLRAREIRTALGDAAALARIERRLGLLSYVWGQVEQSLAHFDAALEHARRAGRPDIEVRALVAKGTALQTMGSVADAKLLMHQALAIVEPLGNDGVTARVERALQALYTISGPVDLAREFGRRALAHAEISGERGVAWSSHWTSAALGGLTANGAEVAHHCAEAARIARELNSPMLAANIAEVKLEFSTASGEWAEGLALAEQIIPVARAVSPRALLPRILVWTGTILLYRGETERAKTYFDEAWQLSRAGAPDATAGDINTVIVAHVGQAAYHLATRNWLAAVEYAQRGLAIGDRYKYFVWAVYRLLPILGEGALWLGDFALAQWVGTRLRDEAPKLSDRLGRAYVAALEGLLLRLEHNRPEAIPRLLAAADEFEAVSYLFYGARLRRNTAQMMWKVGDRDGAARELRRAHDVFLRLGAAGDLQATREEMRQLGMRPPTRTVLPGGVLTEREREIAQLVAQHKTNKEIAHALDISSRTVSTHLSNVFQKLGVDSRAALSDAIRADVVLKG